MRQWVRKVNKLIKNPENQNEEILDENTEEPKKKTAKKKEGKSSKEVQELKELLRIK